MKKEILKIEKYLQRNDISEKQRKDLVRKLEILKDKKEVLK